MAMTTQILYLFVDMKYCTFIDKVRNLARPYDKLYPAISVGNGRSSLGAARANCSVCVQHYLLANLC